MALSQSSSSVSSHPIDGPPCHCSRQTVLVMAWTDANPGRRFYKCYLHGFSPGPIRRSLTDGKN
ncbi:unnamed protein product [Brassica rapa subsp. trilocularis]